MAAFLAQKRVSILVALAVIGRSVFLLIPNLKYVWFLGTAVDQQRQFALTNYVVANGHVSGSDAIYSATPLIHILFSVFSIVPGISVNDSIKYLPVFLSALFPLIVYILLKSLRFSHETALLKIGLFISSIPISIQSYLVTGSQFGLLIAALAFLSLILLLERNDRRYLVIFAFFVLALGLYHTVSSTLFMIFLCGLLLAVQGFRFLRLTNYLKVNAVLIAILTSAGLLTFQATAGFTSIVQSVFSGLSGGSTAGSESVPSSFFTLLRADPAGAVMTILVNYGGDILFLLLALGGLLFLIKKRKELSNAARLVLLFGGLILLFIPVGEIIKAGIFRLVFFGYPFVLIFSSVFLFYLSLKRKWVCVVLFLLMFILAPIELYACQPLIPSANVINNNLPKTEPFQYVGQVTSIYQREMIWFVQNYFTMPKGRIAADSTTSSQVLGLAGYNYTNEHITYYNPLDTSQPRQAYAIFLIHLPGKAGILSEAADFRSPNIVLNEIYNSSIIYSNGESFVLVPGG